MKTELLLSAGAAEVVNNRDERDLTALTYALKYRPEMVARLLQVEGIDINSPCGHLKWTPLHYACRYDRVEETKLLLSMKNINIHAVDSKELMTPLHMACRAGGTGCLTAILEQGTNEMVNKQDRFGYTALNYAAEYKNKQKVELILTNCKDVDINIQNSRGYTPLHSAISVNSNDTIHLLLSLKPNFTLITKTGDSVLHFAVKCCGVDVVQALVSNGCTKLINTVNSKGLTPLHVAVRYQSAVVKLLLEIDGIDINAMESVVNWTPLKLAVRYGSIHTVNLLLSDRRIKVNTLDHNGTNELHIAASDGSPELIKLLIESGVDVNAVSTKGQTPLSNSISNTKEVMALLIDAGADVNFQSLNASSSLHEAIRVQDLSKCMFLVSKGVNLQLKWGDLNALQLAIHYNVNHDIVAFLASHHFSSVPRQIYFQEIVNLYKTCNFLTDDQSENRQDVAKTDLNKQTILHHAVSYGIKEHVSEILSLRGNMLALDKNLVSPLQSSTKHYHILRIMLANIGIEQIKENEKMVQSLAEFAKWYQNKDVLNFLSQELGLTKLTGETDFLFKSRVSLKLEQVAEWQAKLEDVSCMLDCQTKQPVLPNIGSISENPQANIVRDAILQFINVLSVRMKSLDPLLKFTPLLYGSTAEGTKCKIPDEFDFLCCLTNLQRRVTLHKIQNASDFFNTFVQVKLKSCSVKAMRPFLNKFKMQSQHFKHFKLTYSKQRAKTKHRVLGGKIKKRFRSSKTGKVKKYKHIPALDLYLSFSNFLNSDGDFQTTAFLAWFNHVLHLAIEKDSPIWSQCSQHIYVSNHKEIRYKDGLANIQLRWKCDTYKDMLISIDMIPTLKVNTKMKFSESHTHEDILQECQMFAIPKVSGYFGLPNEMRLSYSDAETQMMLHCPSPAKQGYILSKVLRNEHICPKVFSTLTGDTKSAEETIQSYYLKTAFFHSLQDYKDILIMEDEEEADTEKVSEYKKIGSNSLWWAERIYNTLEKYAEEGRMPSYFVSQYDVLYNLESQEDADLIFIFQHNRFLREKKELILAFCHMIKKVIDVLK